MERKKGILFFLTLALCLVPALVFGVERKPPVSATVTLERDCFLLTIRAEKDLNLDAFQLHLGCSAEKTELVSAEFEKTFAERFGKMGGILHCDVKGEGSDAYAAFGGVLAGKTPCVVREGSKVGYVRFLMDPVDAADMNRQLQSLVLTIPVLSDPEWKEEELALVKVKPSHDFTYQDLNEENGGYGLPVSGSNGNAGGSDGTRPADEGRSMVVETMDPDSGERVGQNAEAGKKPNQTGSEADVTGQGGATAPHQGSEGVSNSPLAEEDERAEITSSGALGSRSETAKNGEEKSENGERGASGFPWMVLPVLAVPFVLVVGLLLFVKREKDG